MDRHVASLSFSLLTDPHAVEAAEEDLCRWFETAAAEFKDLESYILRRSMTDHAPRFFLRDDDGGALYLAELKKGGGGRSKDLGSVVKIGEREYVLAGRIDDDAFGKDVTTFVAGVRARSVLVGSEMVNFEPTEKPQDRVGGLLKARGSSFAQSLSPIAMEIVEQLTDWYSESTVLDLVVNSMADAIEAAHEVSPKSWCTTVGDSRKVNLNVGQNRLFGLSATSDVRVAVQDRTLNSEVRTRIEDAQTYRFEFKGKAGGVLRMLAVADFVAVADRLSPAFLELARESARCFRGSPWKRSHIPAVVEALEYLSDRRLPQPEYFVMPSYWKISPEQHESPWKEWRDGGHVAMGWAEFGDLSGVDRVEFDRIFDRLAGPRGWEHISAEQAWDFIQIPVGARVVVNEGTKKVLGVGTVIKGYHFVNGDDLPHRLKVRWDDLTERRVNKPGWTRPLIKLSVDDFEAIVAAEGSPMDLDNHDGEVESEQLFKFDDICSNLSGKGFHFSDELIASYLLALQAKRFVILSGISGTGKTALALEIAKAFAGEEANGSGRAQENTWEIMVRSDSSENPHFLLPSAWVDLYPDFMDSVAERKTMMLRYPGGEQSVRVQKMHRSCRWFVALSGDAGKWFANQFSVHDQFRICRESDGDLWAVRIIDPEGQCPFSSGRQYEVVAVRPDWTDNHGLLGFHNPITGDYATTPFLRIILRAHREHEQAKRKNRIARPFFVILDEMNLARVEHYFSDFLSCLESGEPIVLHDDLSLEATGEVPCALQVPENLFFTGTVNVDESTYMFSPKVLDRAFTLEFNDVDLDTYGTTPEDDDGGGASPLRLTQFGGRLRALQKPTPKDWSVFRARSPDLAAIVSRLNGVLRASHRHFGYRVVNEISRFMNLAEEQAESLEEARWASLDVALVAKALPKLSGTQQELEDTLTSLFTFTVDPEGSGGNESDWGFTDNRELVGPKVKGIPLRPRLPRTATKIFLMLCRLRAQGFTSFID